jgi:hypothetical protein
MKLSKSAARVRDEQCPNYVIAGINGVSIDEMCKAAWKYGFDAGYAHAMKSAEKLVGAMSAALNESARAKTHGCAITNVCLKEYLEPAIEQFKRDME